MGVRLLQKASAQGADHENTTTENTIARKTFAINELGAGKIYRFSCAIVFSVVVFS